MSIEIVDITDTAMPQKRGRGRPPKDWTARSMLVMPLPMAFVTNISERPQRDVDVIGRWLGTHGRRETLKEIGERYDISGERCRQIVKRFGLDVLGGEEGVETFIRICTEATANGPISLYKMKSWKAFESISMMPTVVIHMMDIVKMIHPEQRLPDIVMGRDAMEMLPTDKTTWERAQVITKRIVRLASSDAVEGRVAEMLPELSLKHRAFLIGEAKASNSNDVLQVGDIRKAVRILLEDSSEPVSVSEIARRMAQITGTTPAENYVRNTAAAVGIRIGRGLYTSERNLGLSRDDIEGVIGIVLETMKQDTSDREWRTSEFLDAVNATMPNRPKMTPELIAHILSGCDDVQSAGRMVFKLSERTKVG